MIDPLLRAGSRLWQALFWVLLAVAAGLAMMPQRPRLATGAWADKYEHMLAFAVLALVARVGFPAVSRLRLWLLLTAFGAAIELVQAIPQLHRDSSFIDWVVDAVAAALVLAVPAMLARPRSAAAEG